MDMYKEKLRKSISFSLLFFPIFVGIMGTISLIVLVTWGIPQEDLQAQIPTILILALVIYGACAISLFLRSIFLRKGGSFK
ncbi:hypothetical protein Q75_00605 [Bacillus coahuilensis p1.1.43]|uniref:Uncharacterized protein n=1 Tax=Bacillus coahuilensis p1.1.43 TaxID=1150625 RepID=A0A147KCP5_9BACI|nr:hypothetical protein [Bacillus coahuilensis]KUP09455.1 hypothetical protein Q75_00605 [Bacillus coahuilensis p1.1.43]